MYSLTVEAVLRSVTMETRGMILTTKAVLEMVAMRMGTVAVAIDFYCYDNE